MFRSYRQYAAWVRKQRMIEACNPANWFLSGETRLHFYDLQPIQWFNKGLLAKSRQMQGKRLRSLKLLGRLDT